MKSMEIIDLTLKIRKGMPVYPIYIQPIIHKWTSS